MTDTTDRANWTPAAILDETLHHTAPGLVTEITDLLSGEQVVRLCQAIGRAQEIAWRHAEDAAVAADLTRLYDEASARITETLAAWRAENQAKLAKLNAERFETTSRLD
jgi:hypothetical protein